MAEPWNNREAKGETGAPEDGESSSCLVCEATFLGGLSG